MDLGCDMGTMSIEFAKNGAKMIGVDYSEIGVSIAHKLYNAIGMSTCSQTKREAHNLYSMSHTHFLVSEEKEFDFERV